jgi:hypothetical protein
VAQEPVPFDPADDVPELLVRLYDHNHDPTLLSSLFSFALDGARYESLRDLRVGLLGEHPLHVLDFLRHSRGMTEDALHDLLPTERGVSEEPDSKNVIHQVRRSLRQAKPSVRRYGRWFLREYARRLRANDSAPKARC